MNQTYYSSGKEKQGGFSGILIFKGFIDDLRVSHGSSNSYYSEYKRALHVNFSICDGTIELEYIIYDDVKDYKTILDWIEHVKTSPDSMDIINRKIVKFCLKEIVKNEDFNIITTITDVYIAGIKEGRKQKANQIKDCLNENEN